MPDEDAAYATAGAGGALRLKGGRVEKHKHKHKHKKRAKERKDKEERRGGERSEERNEKTEKDVQDTKDAKDAKDTDKKDQAAPADPDDDDPYARMTPAERRFMEAQDRKIRDLMHASPEEARAAHPELFKSHKERLADLNTYLSRLTEHHDMPKIGPG